MTARELIKTLQELGEENLARECITFDGPTFGVISRVQVLQDEWGYKLQGKIMID